LSPSTGSPSPVPLRTLPSALLLALGAACASPPEEPYGLADLEPVRSLVAEGRYDEAWDILESQEREYYDRDAQAEFSRLAGEVAWQLGDKDRAIRHYEEYIFYEAPDAEAARLAEERLFELGLELLEGRRKAFGIFPDRTRGATTLLHLASWAPLSDLADDALARVGEWHFQDRQFRDAIEDYRLLLRFHPDSEWADLAEFRIGHCQFLMIDGPWVDGRLIDGSLRQIQEYLRKYPSGLYRDQAEELVQTLEELSAGHHLVVGEYYEDIGNLRGARYRYRKASEEHAETEAAAEARRRLAALPPPEEPETGGAEG